MFIYLFFQSFSTFVQIVVLIVDSEYLPGSWYVLQVL